MAERSAAVNDTNDAALAVWLRLREQADWKARSVALTRAVAATLSRDRPVHVLDLATGAGSNLRYLAPHLPKRQRWLLVDRSTALLSDGEARTRAWAVERGYAVFASAMQGDAFSPGTAGPRVSPTGFSLVGADFDCRVDTRALDLRLLDDLSLFAGRDLVTASALLDLVSEAWLRTLASGCRAAGASALLATTYDGRFSCLPREPEDKHVRRLMNAHQRRDKGLGGPAQGPEAVACALRCFTDEGYEVMCEASDWVLGPGDAAMQRTLIDGWAKAASEVAPEEAETIASWRLRRLAHVDAGSSHVVVGHRDVAAWRE
jgi:hypothetical protein